MVYTVELVNCLVLASPCTLIQLYQALLTPHVTCVVVDTIQINSVVLPASQVFDLTRCSLHLKISIVERARFYNSPRFIIRDAWYGVSAKHGSQNVWFSFVDYQRT